MTTAPATHSSQSDVNREAVLCTAADNFITVWRAWTAGPHQLLTAEFEETIEELLEVFRQGEIPATCREIADAIRALDGEWAYYQENITTDNQMPRESLWAAVEGLWKAAAAVEDPPPPMRIEPLANLMKDGSTIKPAQIAIMYAHKINDKWVGPFCRDGRPQPSLVFQELETPGSVIPADWVHPQEQARRALERDIMNRRAMWDARRKARGLPAVERQAPESIEDLLRGGVTVRQIVKIKRCTEADVQAEADRLAIALPKDNDVIHPDSRAADGKRKGKLPKIPPKPDVMPEVPGLASEVQAAARLNPSWNHGELATEFGVSPERIGEILAGGAGTDPPDTDE